jgi:hypothetical protein
MENNVLVEAQYDFRKQKSTDTESHTLTECVQEALDRRLHVMELLLDLSKAYDVINHDILLDKLNSYGIRGESNLYFKSHFSN